MAAGILDYFKNFVKMDVWFLFALLSIPVIVIGSSLFFRWARKRAKFVTMLNKLPHSKGNFLLGNLMEFKVPRVGLFEAKIKFGQRFKNEILYCVWIGPSEVIVELTKAEAVEALLGSNRFLEKTKYHRYAHPWLGDGLLLSGGSEWHTRRKTLTPSFSVTILDGFVDVFNEQAIILVSKMHPHANSYKSFDVYPLVSHCALDIICEKLETAMQKNINSQADGASEYVKTVYDTTKIVMERAMKPWLSFDWLFNVTSLGKKLQKNVAILHGFTDKVIAERRQEQDKPFVSLKEQESNEDKFQGKKKLAFLDTLLNCSENGQKLNEKTIRSEVDTFMFAGHDTTSCGIIWTLFLLGQYKYRDIHHKVHEELDTIFGEGDSKRNLTSSDLKEIKYLECVIKESLRLYPPVPHYGRFVDKDMHIAGYDIPGGVTVMVQPYMVHRDPRYFPDPEVFDPDRFLPENSSMRPLYSYIPFSAGSRNCIGQKFALMEMKTILAHILHQFLVTSIVSQDEMELLGEVVLRPVNGMLIKVEKR